MNWSDRARVEWEIMMAKMDAADDSDARWDWDRALFGRTGWFVAMGALACLILFVIVAG